MSNPTLPPTLDINPERGYREWHIDEVYTPSNPNNKGTYVPNKDDAVRDWAQGIMRVISVDYTTGISILKKWSEPVDPGKVTDEDVLLGAGPGYQSESYKVFLDTSVFPHTLTCARRLHFYGTTVNSIKIFLGTDISANGDVISAFYDTAGNYLGDNIPVEPVAMFQNGVTIPGETTASYNIAVKSPKVGHTTRKLKDGEVVTVVAFDVAGQAVSQSKLLIKNTAFVRQTDANLKYVSNVAVETPFLLASDPSTIEYPVNMPVDNLNLIGVVTYSDGSQIRLPIDGTKFSMFGLRNYVATIQGQSVPLMLSYQLSSNESPYLTEVSPNRKVNVPYHARTRETDGAYSVKLYVIPTWVDQMNGYRLEYYLYNLNRQRAYRVTNLVTHATNTAAFDPLLFNVKQRLSVGVNMTDVDPLFTSWRHTQAIEVTLLRPGNQDIGDNWLVSYTPGQEPAFGLDLKAVYEFVNVNNNVLDISCGKTTLEEWLAVTYYPLQPLYDSHAEAGPLEPNFVVISSGVSRVEIPVANWKSKVTVASVPGEGRPIFLEFIRRTANNDLQLAVAGLIAHQKP